MNTEVLYLIVGQAIREVREEAHLSQEQLAEIIGLNRTSVVNMESGNQRIQLDTVYKIALHFDKPLDFFLPTPSLDLFDPINDAFQKFLKTLRK